jgi:hypothetical protein
MLTVKEMQERQPGIALRWAIFNEAFNGLAASGAVVRVGRRVLIDPVLFDQWMRSNPTMSPPKPKAGQKVAPRRRSLSLPAPVVILDAE